MTPLTAKARYDRDKDHIELAYHSLCFDIPVYRAFWKLNLLPIPLFVAQVDDTAVFDSTIAGVCAQILTIKGAKA